MYPLGNQFEFDKSKGISNQKAIFQGEKYRITVLTERLVRLEYQEEGKFEDRLTELVINRSFPIPKFQFKEDAVSLEITTSYFHLFYLKNKSPGPEPRAFAVADLLFRPAQGGLRSSAEEGEFGLGAHHRHEDEGEARQQPAGHRVAVEDH